MCPAVSPVVGVVGDETSTRSFEVKYWKQLQGPEAAAMSAEQMAAVLAMFPLVGKAMARMQKDGDKLAGTPLDTTTTFESVMSKDQLTQAQASSSSSNSGGGGIGGLLAKKIMKKEEPKARSTIFTMHHEVLVIKAQSTVQPAAIEEEQSCTRVLVDLEVGLDLVGRITGDE